MPERSRSMHEKWITENFFAVGWWMLLIRCICSPPVLNASQARRWVLLLFLFTAEIFCWNPVFPLAPCCSSCFAIIIISLLSLRLSFNIHGMYNGLCIRRLWKYAVGEIKRNLISQPKTSFASRLVVYYTFVGFGFRLLSPPTQASSLIQNKLRGKSTMIYHGMSSRIASSRKTKCCLTPLPETSHGIKISISLLRTSNNNACDNSRKRWRRGKFELHFMNFSFLHSTASRSSDTLSHLIVLPSGILFLSSSH